MSEVLQVERAGPVARVWLNRPDVRNAFNDDLIAELARGFAGFAGRRRAARRSSSAAAARPSAPAPTSAGCETMAGYTWEQNRADAAGPGRHAVDGLAAARCRSSAASMATATPAASAWRPSATCSSPPTPRPSASARRGSACCRRRSAPTSSARSASRRRGATSPPPNASTRPARTRSASSTSSCAADALDATVDALVATLVANGPMAARACKRLVQDVAGLPIDAGAARRDRAPHRRHPRQRRRPRGRAELPGEAQARAGCCRTPEVPTDPTP